jgi:undecaprenyl-diphosphatase
VTLRAPTWRLVTGVAVLVVLPLAVLARIGWRPLVSADRSVDRSAHTAVLAHGWLLSAARALTHFGDPAVVTLLAFVGALALYAAGQRRAALYLLGARAVAVLVSTGVKDVVRRARPVLDQPVAHAGGFSFPSGHAVGSAALYASLAIVVSHRLPMPVRIAIGVVPPVVVGVTRVLLGVHFPSDVVGGLVLGWAVALLLAAAVLTPRAART